MGCFLSHLTFATAQASQAERNLVVGAGRGGAEADVDVDVDVEVEAEDVSGGDIVVMIRGSYVCM